MGHRHRHNHHFFVLKLLYLCYYSMFFLNDHNAFAATAVDVHVGVVLDLNSPMGSMADLCMRMAISDFYEGRSNYSTRLKLHTKNAGSLLDANFAAIDLLKHEEVHGIIGPQNDIESAFIAELGGKVRVPVISFAERSSRASNMDRQYVFRTPTNDTDQARALAAICQGFGWSAVAVLYEDTDNGYQFLSNLNEALKDIDVGLAYMTAIPTTVTDRLLEKELRKLATKQTRVFVVHMSPALGYRFFGIAKRVGVMEEGYAWIISDSLANFASSMDYATRDSMEGVLGIRPHVHRSKELEDFQERWKRNAVTEGKSPVTELNIYGLWAYDTVTALATALERFGPVNSTSLHVNATRNGTEDSILRISTFGPELLIELSRTRFRGLTGEFQLVDGKLDRSAFEIFNIYGSGEKTIGYWTPNRGITRDISLGGEGNYSTSVDVLKTIVWPGDSTTRPKGWAIPATGILRVGIPWKLGFTEFVNVTVDRAGNHTNATGFAIDIFLAALDFMPYHINYEFQHYNDSENIDWSYDDMLNGIPQKYDMVVGDTTIWAPRAENVDFSLPYSESGVVLVVKNRKSVDMWIFLKPLRWDLWLTLIGACVVMGIVIRILERRGARNNEDPMRSRKEKRGNMFLSPIAALAFPERDMVSNNWSFFVLIFWLFMAFILMQSYTANLSAILTVDQLQFAFSDNYYVGFQEGSFMKKFLTEQLHISESRLISYSSSEEYHAAMSLGSKNGGIDAIFDEIPYMKIFLTKYDSQYKMVGPTYRTGGFGFAFPVGSPLVSLMSKAIVDVTQGPEMTRIEQTNFGPGYSSQDPLSARISQGASSLTLHDFAGLFLIIGSVIVFSLFCSETPIGRKLTEKSKHFLQLCLHFKTPRVDAMDSSISGDSVEFGGHELQEYRENNAVSAPAVGEGTDTVVTEQVLEFGGSGGEVHESSESSGTSTPELGAAAVDDTAEQGVGRNQ